MEAADNKEPVSASHEHVEQKPESDQAIAAKTTGLKGTRSLRKLRDGVERAAQELTMLREKNAQLQAQIEALESSPVSDGEDAGVFMVESDPEALKRKVEGFIEAIDTYLDQKDISE